MKKFVFVFLFLSICVFLFPMIAVPQKYWNEFSQTDYSWKYIGNRQFSQGNASSPCLAFSPSGQPYVAFVDANGNKATVMMFNGTNWVNVGNSVSAPGFTGELSMTLSPTGQPYIAFSDLNRVCWFKLNELKFNNFSHICLLFTAKKYGKSSKISCIKNCICQSEPINIRWIWKSLFSILEPK